jgi:hypothetical protein
MTTEELERAAYARGDVTTAGLLARIADLQAALGRATAEIEQLKDDLYVARHERAYLGAID